MDKQNVISWAFTLSIVFAWLWFLGFSVTAKDPLLILFGIMASTLTVVYAGINLIKIYFNLKLLH